MRGIRFVPGKGADDDSGGSADTSKRMVNLSEYNKVTEVIFLLFLNEQSS